MDSILKHLRPNLLKPFQLVMAKIGVDLKIFQILKESEDPVTVSQLAEKSGAAPGLLGRYPFIIVFEWY